MQVQNKLQVPIEVQADTCKRLAPPQAVRSPIAMLADLLLALARPCLLWLPGPRGRSSSPRPPRTCSSRSSSSTAGRMPICWRHRRRTKRRPWSRTQMRVGLGLTEQCGGRRWRRSSVAGIRSVGLQGGPLQILDPEVFKKTVKSDREL
jgi:hypothetical protein